jgi:hypothetical protein
MDSFNRMGVYPILLGLLFVFFAKQIFNFSVKCTPNIYKRWPNWMLSFWPWYMRIFGAAMVLFGIMIFLKVI